MACLVGYLLGFAVSTAVGTIKIAFVHLGADYFFTRSERSDPETSITFVDGGEIGLSRGLGGKLDVTAGDRTYGASARASGEIYAEFGNGDTWVFASCGEVNRFESWLRREKNEDRRGARSSRTDGSTA